MLNHRIIEDKGIVVVEPASALSSEDFQKLTNDVNQYLASHDVIHGLLIHAERFPGWDSFAGLTSHLRFVRDHHQKIERVAIVTDSHFGDLAQAIGEHFVAAEVRHFAFDKYDEAMQWLENKASSPSAYVPCGCSVCSPVHH